MFVFDLYRFRNSLVFISVNRLLADDFKLQVLMELRGRGYSFSRDTDIVLNSLYSSGQSGGQPLIEVYAYVGDTAFLEKRGVSLDRLQILTDSLATYLSKQSWVKTTNFSSRSVVDSLLEGLKCTRPDFVLARYTPVPEVQSFWIDPSSPGAIVLYLGNMPICRLLSKSDSVSLTELKSARNYRIQDGVLLFNNMKETYILPQNQQRHKPVRTGLQLRIDLNTGKCTALRGAINSSVTLYTSGSYVYSQQKGAWINLGDASKVKILGYKRG